MLAGSSTHLLRNSTGQTVLAQKVQPLPWDDSFIRMSTEVLFPGAVGYIGDVHAHDDDAATTVRVCVDARARLEIFGG